MINKSLEKNISVIIPSYNSAGTIIHTLDSLRNQDCDRVKETIVVDSSDSPDMREIIARHESDDLIFINAGIRVKPALGRNIGADKARGNILLFLDSDVILEKNYISCILDAYEQGMLVGCGGIGIPDFQKDNYVVLAQYYLQLSEYIPIGKTRPKKILAGCNLYCDRDIFFRAGKFPDIRASEDVILGLNINKITNTWFIPAATVRHIFREDKSGYLDNQKLLGTYVGIMRSNMSGSCIYKGIVPAFLMPIFFVYKCFLVMSRVGMAGGGHIVRFCKVLPIVTVGILFWTIGMVKGVMKNSR